MRQRRRGLIHGHRYTYQAFAERIQQQQVLQASHLSPTQPLMFLLHSDTEGSLVTSKQGGVHVIPAAAPIVCSYCSWKVVHTRRTSSSFRVLVVLTKLRRPVKPFETKFVVWGGMQQGGLKGRF